MKRMEEVLDKVYANPELRQSIVPLFIGNPGMGKTVIIEKFAKEKGAKLIELITSQMSPFEISGIAMPDKETQKMTYYNFDKLESLKDGDILFFDELLNGNPVVLNACLTILEQRRLISGKPLPKVMIVAAANPQGMVPLTPQIKERFLWYNVAFDKPMWQDFMHKKYAMPYNVSIDYCKMILDEKFVNNNFNTPRSIDKAISMIAQDCPTTYKDVVGHSLKKKVYNYSKVNDKTINHITLKPNESVKYIDTLKPGTVASKVVNKVAKEKAPKKRAKYQLMFHGPKHHCKGKTVQALRDLLKEPKWRADQLIENGPFNMYPDGTTLAELKKAKAFMEKAGAEITLKSTKDKKYTVTNKNAAPSNGEALSYLIERFEYTEKQARKILSDDATIVCKDIHYDEAHEIQKQLQTMGQATSIK